MVAGAVLWVPAEPEVTTDRSPQRWGHVPPRGSATPGLFFLPLPCGVRETEAPAVPAVGLGCPKCCGQGSAVPLALPAAFPQPASSQHPSPARFPRDSSLKGSGEPRCSGCSAPGPAGHKDGLIEWPGLAGNKRPLVSRWGGRGDNGDPGPSPSGVGLSRGPALRGAALGFGAPPVSSLQDGKGSECGMCQEGFAGREEEEG